VELKFIKPLCDVEVKVPQSACFPLFRKFSSESEFFVGVLFSTRVKTIELKFEIHNVLIHTDRYADDDEKKVGGALSGQSFRPLAL
jgi:hypothetical protein